MPCSTACSCAATDRDEAVAFSSRSTRNLLEAERQTGAQHHVLLSIVGLTKVTGNAHYAGKRAQEEVVERGAVPWSIVPATHIHDFAEMVTTWTERDGSATIAPLLVQPVAPADVADVRPRSPSDSRKAAARSLQGPSRRTWSISRAGRAPLAAPRSDWYPRGRAFSASTWPATCCCRDRTRASLPRRSTTGSPARRAPDGVAVDCPTTRRGRRVSVRRGTSRRSAARARDDRRRAGVGAAERRARHSRIVMSAGIVGSTTSSARASAVSAESAGAAVCRCRRRALAGYPAGSELASV